jgi:hypothetical protein
LAESKILILIDRNRLELNKKWFGSSHFKGISIFRAQFVDPRLEMAPSKSLKLVPEKLILEQNFPSKNFSEYCHKLE